MFHTYVKASSGAKIDIDRARYLMDNALFCEAERDIVKMMTPCGFNPFDIAVAKRMNPSEMLAARVWHNYCRLHQEKYGAPFEPDVNPDWDQ